MWGGRVFLKENFQGPVICFSEIIRSSLYFDSSHMYVMEGIQQQQSFLKTRLCSRGCHSHRLQSTLLWWTLELGNVAALPPQHPQDRLRMCTSPAKRL